MGFFFSSRRRHTRCYRDWSSDVCSSDLGGALPGDGTGPIARTVPRWGIEVPGPLEGVVAAQSRVTSSFESSLSGTASDPHRRKSARRKPPSSEEAKGTQKEPQRSARLRGGHEEVVVRSSSELMAWTYGQRRRLLRSWCGSGGEPRHCRNGVRPAARASGEHCWGGTACRLPPRWV